MGRKQKADIRKPEILEHFYQVVIEEGIEGASVGKVAKHMGVHPSLLIHFFSTKEEMTVGLVDFILQKYEDTFLDRFHKIKDPKKRVNEFFNTIFGLDWVSIVDSSAFHACYNLSFRHARVKKRLNAMYERFKALLIEEIEGCMKEGIMEKGDPQKIADLVIIMIEGFNYYKNIISDDRKYKELGLYIKGEALRLLKIEV